MEYTDKQILEIVDINQSKKALENFTLEQEGEAAGVLSQMLKYPNEFTQDIIHFKARRAGLIIQQKLGKSY